MVALGHDVRQQFGRLGIAPDALGAQLEQMSPERLRRLGASALPRDIASAAPARRNRFSAEVRDGRSSIPKAFSNPTPTAARSERARFLGATYAEEPKSVHASADFPLKGLMHPRRGEAAKLGLAVQRRPELRERVGVSLGAQIVDDGRSDGVISVSRGTKTGSTGVAPPIAPPAPTYGTGSIWEIMMAMDQAILDEAARLGLGQGSGTNGTVGMMEAMGLWSLKPDDSDPSEWAGLSSGNGGGSTGSTASGMTGNNGTGTVGPESENSGLDVDIMRLKRQIDKKTQMMELYSQTMSKYNSSANAIIGNMKA